MDILEFVEKQGSKDSRGKGEPKVQEGAAIAHRQDGRDTDQRNRESPENTSQANRRKLDAYDDQTLPKFTRKPMPMALKAELRTRFLFVGLTLSSHQ